MLFSGSPQSGKTRKLVDIYIDLINGGVDVESVLVLSSNAYRKQDFITRVKSKLNGGFPNFKIYTFHGVVYNTVKDFWPLIEKNLKGKHQILPHLSGLESCEFLLKDCVREQNSKNKYELTFEDFYGDRSLISQLIRRYRLMSENLLSFDELNNRSKIIKQQFSLPANEALKCLKIKSSKIRVLDFVSQMNAFNFLLQREKLVQEHFKKIQYLLVDDYDECTPACQNFVKTLLPDVKDFYISFDPDGGSRRGYLGAYPDGWKEFVNDNRSLKVNKLVTQAPLIKLAEELFASIKTQTPVRLPELKLKAHFNRIDMFEDLKKTLDNLIIDQDVNVEDIVIVIPHLDNTVKANIDDYCAKTGIKYQLLTGSNKPIDNPRVHGTVILLQLLNPDWKLIPDPYDVRLMLSSIIGLPPLVADSIAQEYEKLYKDNPVLPNIMLTDLKEDFYKDYQNLLSTIDEIKKEKLPLYNQMIRIFTEIIAPDLSEDEPVDDFNKILDSLLDFMSLLEKYNSNLDSKITERDWLLQVKNEYVAENPVAPATVNPDTLVVATPQKIVDIELKSKYQIWLDVSSSGWTRTQTAALYNAWAYSNYFDQSEYDDLRFTHSIAAHMLRSLLYNCEKDIIALASNLDSMGNEQHGWLIQYLGKGVDKYVPQNPPRLRDDQKDILNYKGGTLAVTAVPGAGKTFINVALIVKLIEDGVNPENILVLTYMESAAQTLINRIKTIFPELNVLPQISTIHGLAYKIIRDDDNLAKLGLPDDIDVADDAFKDDLLNTITNNTLPEFDDFQKWKKHITSSISLAKSLKVRPRDINNYFKKNKFQELKEFYIPYKLYSEEMEHKGLIDFDDQIGYAIELLEKFPEVRKKYQQQYKYIIEDEAQDSTLNQQKLLSILIKGHNNFVRTGDINQAIMTTFTPVDVEGFRRFIKEADTCIEMNHSQRCAKPVYTFANELIEWSKSFPELKNAFYDIKINPVEGCNPDIKDDIFIKVMEDTDAEMNLVAQKLHYFKDKIPGSSFAVLVRTNNDAIAWTNYLDSQGFQCICFTDSIQQQKVFNLIYNYLKVILKPFNNKYIQTLYNSMIDYDLIKKDPESEQFIKHLGSPLVSFDMSELPTVQVAQLYFDILYWLEFANLPVSELIIKLSQELFDDPIDRSNGYILSIVAEKFKRDQTKIRYKENFDLIYDTALDLSKLKPVIGLPQTVEYFDQLIRFKKLKGFRFLEKEEEDDSKAGYVQIMTVHKAKGMGFDVVFVPHIWENRFSYTTKIENIPVQATDKLELQLKELTGKSVDIENLEQKARLNQLEENMRLLYVAVTRAKKYLFLTSSRKDSKRGYKKEPSRLLQSFIENKQQKLKLVKGS